MTHDNTLWHSQSLQLLLFKPCDIKVVIIINLMQQHIEKCTRCVLDCFKALIEPLCRIKLIKKFIGDGLTRFKMSGILFQHFWLFEPVLHQLRWKLHKVCQDIGGRKTRVGAIRKHPMMTMSLWLSEGGWGHEKGKHKLKHDQQKGSDSVDIDSFTHHFMEQCSSVVKRE